MRGLVLGALAILLAFPAVAGAEQLASQSLTLADAARARDVPVQLYFPAAGLECVRQRSCPVALLSPGYGLPHTGYSFLASTLAARGFLVVAVQHDLPSDPPLTGEGDLVKVRTPAWQRGADNLRFVKAQLSSTYPHYNWSALTLVGHSNGGDISAFLLAQTPQFAKQLITLDHRRVPLPRDPSMLVLSVRGSDFEADPGVLPPQQEPASSSICVVKLAGSRHNDMHDGGPSELKGKITSVVARFLQGSSCGA